MTFEEFKAWAKDMAEGTKREWEAEENDHGASEFTLGVAEAYKNAYESVAEKLDEVETS